MAEKRRNAPPAPKGQGTMMLFFFVMILIMVDPSIREGLGAGMSYVLNPTIGFGGTIPVISIMLAGTLTGLVSTGLRVWATDFVEMERSRLLQRSFSRQMNDARIRRDTDKLNKLKRAQPYVMSKQMEVQSATMKPALGTMFLAIAVFWWLSVFVAAEVPFKCVSLPWATCWPLDGSFGLPYWIALYSVMSLPFTLAFSSTLKLWRLRNFDAEAVGKESAPSVEDLVARANEEVEDEEVVDAAARRARKRLKGAGGGASADGDDEDGSDDEDDVDDDDEDLEIVEDDEAAIVDPSVKRARAVEEE